MFEDSVSTVPSSIWATMIGWFTPMVFFVLLNVMIGTIALSSTFNKKQNHQNQNQHSQNDPQNVPKFGRATSVLQRLRSINLSRYRSQEPVSHFKSAPDSDTHYSYDNAHQQESIESHTHSIFEQNRSQETETTQHNFQHRHEIVQETHTQFDFQQNHQEKVQETHTQFDFQQNLQETQTQYHFGHAHEEKDEYIEHDFDFNQAHEENVEEEEEEGELQGLDEVYSELSERHIIRTQSDTKPSAGEAPVKLPAKIRKSASMKSPFGHFVEADIVETRRPETTRERNTRMKEVDEEVDTKADDFIYKFKQQLKLQRLDSIIRYKDIIGRGSGR